MLNVRKGLGGDQDPRADELGSRPTFLCILVRGSERGGQVPEKKLQHLLQAILRDDLAVEPPYYITSVRTFEEAGVPSEDRGLVVTMADGSEYQITIVRSQ
jgi:hypothetical protein